MVSQLAVNFYVGQSAPERHRDRVADLPGLGPTRLRFCLLSDFQLHDYRKRNKT